MEVIKIAPRNKGWKGTNLVDLKKITSPEIQAGKFWNEHRCTWSRCSIISNPTTQEINHRLPDTSSFTQRAC